MKLWSTLIKKCSIRTSILSIAFSAMFLVVAPGTKAEPQDGAKENLVSELRLQSASLLGTKMYYVEEKDLKVKPLKGFFIPLKEGSNVFVDCTPPSHKDGLTPKDARANYRAVIGFHFSLR